MDSTQAEQRHVVIYSYSPVFYWWPLWLVGFIFAAVTLIERDTVAWLADFRFECRLEAKRVRQTVPKCPMSVL